MRIATSADIEIIADIYNKAVLEGGFTGDQEPLSLEYRRAWFLDHQQRYCVFVKVIDGDLVGYVALSPYRKGRGAFDGTCEISYYLYKNFRGQGLGAEMVEHAIEKAARSNFNLIVAMILANNRRSIRLLEKLKFTVAGTLPKAAKLNGNYVDHIYLSRSL